MSTHALQKSYVSKNADIDVQGLLLEGEQRHDRLIVRTRSTTLYLEPEGAS